MFVIYISFYSYEDGNNEILGYVDSVEDFILFATNKKGVDKDKAPSMGEYGADSASYDMGTNYDLVCQKINKIIKNENINNQPKHTRRSKGTL